MKVLHRETEVLRVERTTLQTPDGRIIRVLEYIDSNKNVVDSIVRDKSGYEIDDLALTDEVYDFLDAQIPQEDADGGGLRHCGDDYYSDEPEYDGAGFTYEDRVVDGQYRNLSAENAENPNLDTV